LASADIEEKRHNIDLAEKLYKQALERCTNDATLIFIHYMRFTRRTKGLDAARKIFKMGREDPRTTYHLYIAAANMEYYCTKDKQVAFKIYQLGAKKFPNLTEYMLLFIKFMANLNEDNNTRVLFERILSTNELSKDRIHEIWTEFLKFECAVGDLASILKVDKKRQKAIESVREVA
jgi:cleavage stimulation factor subunit 3